MLNTPWNENQVQTLNEFQQIGFMHPYTCPEEHPAQITLQATTAGWVCPGRDCDYTQSWAHDWSADKGAWPSLPPTFRSSICM